MRDRDFRKVAITQNKQLETIAESLSVPIEVAVHLRSGNLRLRDYARLFGGLFIGIAIGHAKQSLAHLLLTR